MRDRWFWTLLASLALAAFAAPSPLLAQRAEQSVPSRKTQQVTNNKARPAAAGPVREVRVTLDSLPSNVRRTLAREATGGKVLVVERQTRGTTTQYEADVRLDGATYEVLIAADGKLLHKTLDNDDDDEDGDDDGDDDDDDEDEDNDGEDGVKVKAPANK
ncbi:MAG TPA: PepSY domain-containing protein [Tepidisphaeraceae bacterium]|nr:PepSY domain-containing protein [Tepidisphaeraceae bacterium]